MHEEVVVVTGGSKGIGRAILEKFNQAGYLTVNLDLDAEAGNELAEKLSQQAPSQFIKTDVSDYDQVLEARNRIIDSFHRLDFLIINAGITYRHSLKEISVSEWDRVISVNLSSSFYLIKACYDDLVKNKGKVVVISSGSGITGTGGGGHYVASKAGQMGFVRTLAKELGPQGVNVNSVAPRVIESDILDQLYPDEASRQELLEKKPIRRFGKGEDIANLTFFLTQEESSYIHGQILLADGGRTF